MSTRHPGVPAPKAEANFALRMRLLREARGISQAEIAARVTRMGMALPQQTIARIETGKRSLRLDEATAIARALSVDLFDMLSDPVEVRDARNQLKAAEADLGSLRAARLDADVELEKLDRARVELSVRVKQFQEEEARMEAVTEYLRAAVAELDKGDE